MPFIAADAPIHPSHGTTGPPLHISDINCCLQVARSNDHNPKTTTFLWYVDLPMAYKKLEQARLPGGMPILIELTLDSPQSTVYF